MQLYKEKEYKRKMTQAPPTFSRGSQNFIIYFHPKAPQESKRHHLLYVSTLSSISTTKKQVNYLTRHNLRQPKSA
jgi:hypothetical protein